MPNYAVSHFDSRPFRDRVQDSAQEPIDVVVLTLNSMHPCLPRCLASIFDSIPVDRLIVVDGGSTDETLEYLKGIPRTLIVNDPNGTRATARQKGLDQVRTEVFAFVDSDIVLPSGWYDEILQSLGDDVGGVCGFAMPVERHLRNLYKSMAALYRTGSISGLARYGLLNTSAALMRKSSVKGISIPREFHALDDYFIGTYIKSRGYKVMSLASPICYHFREHDISGSACATDGYLMKKYGIRSLRYLASRAFVRAPIEFLWTLGYAQDFHAASLRLRYSAQTLAGYLKD
jgi:glycosyltransferase involved in cell wall biosynthesis